jgi:hypothetical protein
MELEFVSICQEFSPEHAVDDNHDAESLDECSENGSGFGHASHVERPIGWNFGGLGLTSRQLPPEIAEAHRDWYFTPMRRCWEFGHNSVRMAMALQSIPFHISCTLWEMLKKMQLVMENRTDKLKVGKLLLTGSEPAASEIDDETAMWQAQDTFGYVKLSFDTATQRRRRVVCNAAQAGVVNMHPEELEARFANYDLWIVGSDLDFVYIFVDDLIQNMADAVQYFRLNSSHGETKSGVLVCNARKPTYTSTGQVCEASNGPFSAFFNPSFQTNLPPVIFCTLIDFV